MKKTWITIFILFVSITSVFSQKYEFETTEYAYKYVDSDGEWTGWTDWDDLSVRVIIDVSNRKIKIYTKETEIYDVVGIKESIDDDGDEVVLFECISTFLEIYEIKYMNRYDGDDFYRQLYVENDDTKYVYNIE